MEMTCNKKKDKFHLVLLWIQTDELHTESNILALWAPRQ